MTIQQVPTPLPPRDDDTHDDAARLRRQWQALEREEPATPAEARLFWLVLAFGCLIWIVVGVLVALGGIRW